jgi:hypothetical protein
MPALANPASLFFGTGSVNVRLKRINSGQSICSCSARIPFPFIRRAQSTASAPPTSTFLGSHPRSAHVVPTENSIALKNRDQHAIGKKFLGLAKALAALPRVVREMPHRRLGAGAEDHQACGVYVERMPGLLTPPVVRSGGAAHRPAAAPQLVPFPTAELVLARVNPSPTRDAFSIGDSRQNSCAMSGATTARSTR